jgi:hypothetical protein
MRDAIRPADTHSDQPITTITPRLTQRGTLIEADLVITNGTHKHSYWLAGIRTDQLGNPTARSQFWSRARRALDELGNQLSVANRAAVEKEIATKVRPADTVGFARRALSRW